MSAYGNYQTEWNFKKVKILRNPYIFILFNSFMSLNLVFSGKNVYAQQNDNSYINNILFKVSLHLQFNNVFDNENDNQYISLRRLKFQLYNSSSQKMNFKFQCLYKSNNRSETDNNIYIRDLNATFIFHLH